MKTFSKTALALCAALFAAQALAQITLYGREGFEGRSFTTEREVRNLERFGFNDRASSLTVAGGRWEVCEDARFSGRCMIVRPGRYPTLAATGLENSISSVRPIGGSARIDDSRYAPAPVVAVPEPAAQGPAQITLYGRDSYDGRSFTTEREVRNLERFGFNDRASSAIVTSGRWEVCEDTRFSGRCMVLRRGQYPSLTAMGLGNSISSLRPVGRQARIDDNRYAPEPLAAYDYRPRRAERLFEADVVAVRVVVGPPEQRCWVEREQVRGSAVPGVIAGAVIGGILGHQIGGGRDLPTAGGAVAGAAVGANISGRGGVTQDVQKCASVPSQTPAYYDVTYRFRGQEHRVQMAKDPGRTVTVNERGEPRASS
jgi:beta/gamma crystallin/glycine zipper 2TM protein